MTSPTYPEQPHPADRGAEPPPDPPTFVVETPDEPAPPPAEEAALAAFFTRLVPAVRAFRHRHYRLLWSANVLSSVGNWMQTPAYGVLVLHLTKSPFLTAFIPASSQLLLGPLGTFGGMVADRYNRRSILMVTQLVFTMTTVALGALVITGHGSPQAFLAISLVNGVFLTANFPAYQALFPRLIPSDALFDAVALNSVSFNLARIVGPAIGAVVLELWGTGQVFLVNAATFFLFFTALTRIPAEAGRIHARDRSELGSVGDGYRFARRNPTVGTLILGIGTISLFGLPVMWLSPLMAERVFGRATANGFILSALGAGAVLGALVSGALPSDRKPRAGILSYFVFAASLAAFAFVRVPALSLVLIAIFGAAYMGAAVVINSLVQIATPDRLRGRVMSLYMIAWLGLLPLGAVTAGAVAQVVGGTLGAPVAHALGAAVCLAFAIRLAVRRDWVPATTTGREVEGP